MALNRRHESHELTTNDRLLQRISESDTHVNLSMPESRGVSEANYREISANIWNLLWLSMRLIIRTEPMNIYSSTFPDTLTLKSTR